MLTRNAIGIPLPFVGTLIGMGTTVGERIREAREAKGWSQAELARRLKVKPPSVSQLESGDSGAPSSETLLRMRDAGINPDYIMRGKGPKLLEDIEKKLRADTLYSMFQEVDVEQQAVIEDMLRGMIRRKKGSSPNDPFKEDPPGYDPGTQ